MDPAIVVTYSIDHNRVNNELNQTYDQLYLEFLISLQHREITPEDYEYLSRLDELVKKKTVNDNILKNLKSELITADLLVHFDQDQCGICLDSYVLDQVVKYLPCGHRFHSDCIDSWLRNQSTDCPLDKLSVDRAYGDDNGQVFITSHILEESKDVLECLNDLVDQVVLINDELDKEIINVLDELVDDVVVLNQVKECMSNLIDLVTDNSIL